MYNYKIRDLDLRIGLMDYETHLRVLGVISILEESTERLWGENADPDLSKIARSTGFAPSHYGKLYRLAGSVSKHATDGISLEIGCGNGPWTLVAAAMGFPSYGIDINPVLIEEAEKNYQEAVRQGFIDPGTPCDFAAGSVYQGRWGELYQAKRWKHNQMPVEAEPSNPFVELGIELSDVKIIYTLMYASHGIILRPMLEEETDKGTLFLGNMFNIFNYLAVVDDDIYIKNR